MIKLFLFATGYEEIDRIFEGVIKGSVDNCIKYL